MVHNLAPCIGVDASRWMFTAKYYHAQTKNPAQASLFKRMGCLFHLPVIPIFIFDGPGCPANKCNKVVKKTPDWLAADFKRLLVGFGFSYCKAPGKAEAELAMLSNVGHIDAVMSEDFDTMVFGAQCVIRIKDKSDSKYLIEVHEASQFSHNDLILIASLAEGEYDIRLEGVPGCSVQTAAGIARTCIGKKLFNALEVSEIGHYHHMASMWCQDLCTMLDTKGVGQLYSHHCSLASCIPSDFPKVSVLIQYLHPVRLTLENLPAPPLLGQPDLSRLLKLYEELFNFSHYIFPGLVICELLQDLSKRCGLEQPHNSVTVISKVCTVCANQCKQSDSEVFMSLVVPHAILTKITLVLHSMHENDTQKKALTQFMKNHKVCTWLSWVLALHAQTNLLDNRDQTYKPFKLCCNIIATSLTSTVASQTGDAHAFSSLEISSDKSGA
ncbi:PIN domain-like protein [Armillaria novae-zelandiae]|uniref:PIN domain-like protein n=1 Tax=Armillaria novae-zelandiae TaxID=153914 RepID=A0AA39P1P8_9AGAR|nr:PIN domain-like protein [Armillaria novae-zelandiae]